VPVYEYICMKCNNRFSLLQSLYPESKDTQCPKCESTKVKKMISAFSCASASESDSATAHASSFGGGGG